MRARASIGITQLLLDKIPVNLVDICRLMAVINSVRSRGNARFDFLNIYWLSSFLLTLILND